MINGDKEKDGIIILPLILIHLPLRAVKGNEEKGKGRRRGGWGKNAEVIYTHSQVKKRNQSWWGKKNTETSLNPCHLSRRARCVLSHFRGLLACPLFPAQLSKMNHGGVNAQALPGSPAATFLIENLSAHSGRRGKLKNVR